MEHMNQIKILKNVYRQNASMFEMQNKGEWGGKKLPPPSPTKFSIFIYPEIQQPKKRYRRNRKAIT